MKKLILFPIALILLTILISCRNQRVDERMSTAYSLLNSDPDSALSLLSHYNAKDMDDEVRAYYSLIYTIAQDKSGLDVDNDSLLSYAYNYYRQHKDDSLYAKCLYYMGKYYYLNDSTKQSVDLLSEANRVAKEQGDLYTQYLALSRLSMALELSNPKKSLETAKRAYELFCRFDSTNYYNKVFLLMGIGNSFENVKEPDSVLYYMKQSVIQAKIAQDSNLIGEAYHSLSFGFSNYHMLDSALYYAKQAYNFVSSKKTSLAMQLASSYLACDSINEAESILKQVIETKTNLNTRYSAFYYLSEICMHRANDQEGMRYVDSTLTMLRRIYYNAQQEISDYQTANDNLVLETERAEVKLKRSVLIALLIIVVISVLISLLLLNYRNYRKYTKIRLKLVQEQKKAQLEQQELLHRQVLMQKDFEMRARNKDHHAQILQMKNEQEKQKLILKSQEKQLSFAKDYILLKLDFENLQQKLKSEIKRDNIEKSVWFELEIALNEIFCGFVSQFREKHPNLKEDDVQFCMLVKLGLNNAQLEHFYCRELQTIKQRLLNLKPKLGIEDSEQSTREYILNFGA